jgi:hypothetical protein
MNGYNATMREERKRDHDTFTFDPNLNLPDTVGMHININRNCLKKKNNFMVFM